VIVLKNLWKEVISLNSKNIQIDSLVNDIKIEVLGSTSPGFNLSIDAAMQFAGHAAGVCYMPDDMNALFNEPIEKTIKRAQQTLMHGHHSVYDHVYFNLSIEGIPKILAMILNNENVYATSEKSARYTQMKLSKKEKKLYDKWLAVFIDLITTRYPDMSDESIKKLGQENARYLISVFTPTSLVYSTNLRQLNYIRNWFSDFIEQDYNDDFMTKLKPYMSNFLAQTDFLRVDGLIDGKNRKLSFFDTRNNRKTHFGEVYSTSYYGSFAQLAQAQRHRTLSYTVTVADVDPYYYVPNIIPPSMITNWLDDIISVSDLYPQGRLVSICERGTYEDFILKVQERLCSHAQLEISQQTRKTLKKYIVKTSRYNRGVYSVLKQYDCDARCGFGYKCPSPCSWGVDQLSRLV